MKEYTIGPNEAGQRFDKYLAKCMSKAPKSFFYKMMRKKNITLNKKKAAGNEILSEGDVVRIFVSDETFEMFSDVSEVQTALGNLDILYEDSDLVLVNKPVGMLSQPDKSKEASLVEYLNGYLLANSRITKEQLQTFHPSVVNRLDRNTSGIVACGCSLAGLQDLSEMFRKRTLHKFYLCLVEGVLLKEMKLQGYLKKDNEKNQVIIRQKEFAGASYVETRYRPIQNDGIHTLLEVELLTGKTHQIRAHLASIDHPIVGDFKYNHIEKSRRFAKEAGLTSQFLHAWRLELPRDCKRLSPELSGRTFTAPLPQIFQQVLKKTDIKEIRNNGTEK